MQQIISIGKEAREKAMLSNSEAIILGGLYYMENGMKSSELKKALLHLNLHDYDEAEESLDSLQVEGYIRYSDGTWYITGAGKHFVNEFATFTPLQSSEKEPDAERRTE